MTPSGPEPSSAEYFCLLYALVGMLVAVGLGAGLWWLG
jgi:hypothetical protein